MTKNELFAAITERRSYLCVGLDTEYAKLPEHLKEHPDAIFEFNRQIIDATADYCVAYKPNIAFYEALGPAGWDALARTLAYIPKTHFTIADAKRGDIGNTSRLYATAFFEKMTFDAITVAPYMGRDSVEPFLGFEGKWAIILGLTSNVGSGDFQQLTSAGEPIYAHVLRTAAKWGTPENTMFVIGATHPEQFRDVRRILPEHFFLVPGIGAQGGDLAAVSRNGFNAQCGLLVNSSRGIIYASSGTDFAEAARHEAQKIQSDMAKLLLSAGIVE